MPKTSAASRSQGSRTCPAAHFIRFTEAQNTRLHDVAAHKGVSIQAYVQAAAMAALDEDERRQRERANLRESKKLDRDAAPARRTSLRDRLANSSPPDYDIPAREEPPPEPPPAPPAPQIVIAQAAPATAEVDRLAAFVLRGGLPADRPARLATAAQVLATSARDEADKVQLARALDDKIRAIEGQQPPPRTSPIGLFESLFKL